MNREEILENLTRIEGTTIYILIFNHIEDQLLNGNYTKDERLIMLIRMKDKYLQLKPEPNGRYALVSPFAIAMISGTTFQLSTANIFPVLPNPVITSSAISSTL